MAEVVLERLGRPPIGEQRVEIVERKGLGHPDSICDMVMEEIARAINGERRARDLRLACRPDRATDRSTLGGSATDSRVGGGVREDRPRDPAGDRPGAGALVGLLR